VELYVNIALLTVMVSIVSCGSLHFCISLMSFWSLSGSLLFICVHLS
jgi:hypothetical protein